MFKLFYSPGTCALASHVALEEAGAEYTVARVNFSKSEQRSPEYLAVNPKGRVPALITDDGILTETPAILAYIAQRYPQAKLAPLDDPFAFARMQAFNSYLCSTVHVAHAHRMRGTRWADDPAAIEAMQRKVPESVGAAFALIEDDMLKGPWVMDAFRTGERGWEALQDVFGLELDTIKADPQIWLHPSYFLDVEAITAVRRHHRCCAP